MPNEKALSGLIQVPNQLLFQGEIFHFLLSFNLAAFVGNPPYKPCEVLVDIPMGTNCAPLVADLFLFCYERDCMKNLSSDNQADVIKAFNLTSRYLDDLLNIDNPYFEGMVNQIYPSELQLNKAYTSDTEAPFLDLHLSISNGFVSSKIYDKRDDFELPLFRWRCSTSSFLWSIYLSAHKICSSM